MASIFPSNYTQSLDQVIREIEVDPNTFLGAKYMPAVEVPTRKILVDVWEAAGGMTKEHTIGTDPQSVQRRGLRTMEFSSGAYKEYTRFGEADILYLRELGQNDLSQRGIKEHLDAQMLKLNNRIETRIEFLRWQAIFNGNYIYDGKVVDFGVPAAHSIAPAVLWGNSSGGMYTTTNAGSDPISDLRTWVLGGLPAFRKYKINKIVMNPNTARMFLENAKVQQFITSRFASDSINGYDISSVLAFAVPGLPPVEIYAGWYQAEALDAVTGQLTVGDGVFFIPDGKIFFDVSLPDNNMIGDFAMTLNLSNGNYQAPAAGKFLIVDEHIADRPGNPYIDIMAGVYGGPRLKRPFDLLTATVI